MSDQAAPDHSPLDHAMSDQSWRPAFPELDELEPEARAAFFTAVAKVELPEQQKVFAPGQESANWLLVLEGSVRVQHVSATGGRW